MTSVHKYFFKGVDAVANEFHRSKNSVKDKSEALQASNNFNGRAVTQNADEKGVKTVLIDDAVQVTTVPDSVRKTAQDNWNQLAEKSRKTFVATLITGIVLTVAGVVLAGLTAVFPPMILAAVPVFIIGVSLLVVAKRGHTNAKNANLQKTQWNDPVPVIQQHRKNANPDSQGFNYALQNKSLLGQCIHQDEVLHLREQHLKGFIEKHERGVQAGDMETFKSFFKLNPFSNDAVKFANGQRTGHGMDTLIRDYETQERKFNVLLANIKAQRDRVEAERKQAIASLELNRDSELSTLKSIYLSENTTLIFENSILETRKRGSTDRHGRYHRPDLREIQRIDQSIHNNILRMSQNQLKYDIVANPVKERCRVEIVRVNDIASQKRVKIATLEHQEIMKYQGPIIDLLGKFRHQATPHHSSGASDATAPSLGNIEGGNPAPSAPAADLPTAPPLDDLINSYDL
jgi:hypothetical protein